MKFPALLVFSLTVFSRQAWAADTPPRQNALYEQALENYRQKNYLLALDEFSDLLYRDPQTPYGDKARQYIGEIIQRIKKQQAAAEISGEERRRAVQLASQEIRIRHKYSQEVLDELKNVDRNIRDSPHQLLNALSGSKYLSDPARLSFAKEIENLSVQRRLDDIQTALKRQLQEGRFSNNKALHEAKGFLWLYGGDLENAVREWERALAFDVKDGALAANLSKAKTALNAKRTDEETRRLLALGKNFYKVGEFGKALGAFNQLLKIDPRHSEGLKQLNSAKARLDERARQEKINIKLDQAYRQLKNNSLLEAVRSLIDVLQIDPENDQARRELAAIKEKFKLRKVLAQTPSPKEKEEPSQNRQLAENAYTTGMVHYMQGELSEALKLFEAAVKLDGSFEEAARAAEGARKELKQ